MSPSKGTVTKETHFSPHLFILTSPNKRCARIFQTWHGDASGSIRQEDRARRPLDYRSFSHPFFMLVPRILGLSSQPQIHQSSQALQLLFTTYRLHNSPFTCFILMIYLCEKLNLILIKHTWRNYILTLSYCEIAKKSHYRIPRQQ